MVTSHVLAGALIGASLSRRPLLAFTAGVASHFAMDALPHWGTPDDAQFLRVAVVDGLIGLSAAAAVALRCPARWRVPVLAAVAGAVLPDLNKPAVLFLGASPFPRAFDALHGWVQNEAPTRLTWEVAAAGVLALTCWAARRRAVRSHDALGVLGHHDSRATVRDAGGVRDAATNMSSAARSARRGRSALL